MFPPIAEPIRMSKGTAENADNTKVLAERLIAWASIAYGCGFVIVLLHTARIGIPVLDLIKPIYVWVGLPVAFAMFFARQILGHLKRHAAANKAELLRAIRSNPASNASEATDRLIDTVAYITPWYLPRRTVQKIFRSILDRILAAQPDPSNQSRIVKLLDLYARAFRAAEATLNLFNVALRAGLVLGLILLYVWVLYPLIPQAYGGGDPSRVKLLIDTAKLPPQVPDLTGPRPIQASASPSISAEMELLYITSASYFIRGKRGGVIALDKSVVVGIVYLQE